MRIKLDIKLNVRECCGRAVVDEAEEYWGDRIGSISVFYGSSTSAKHSRTCEKYRNRSLGAGGDATKKRYEPSESISKSKF